MNATSNERLKLRNPKADKCVTANDTGQTVKQIDVIFVGQSFHFLRPCDNPDDHADRYIGNPEKSYQREEVIEYGIAGYWKNQYEFHDPRTPD